jgi:hypothetical protein
MSDQQIPNRDDQPDSGELDFTECIPPGKGYTNNDGVTVNNQGPDGNIYISRNAPTQIRITPNAAAQIYGTKSSTRITVLNMDDQVVHDIIGNSGTVIFEGGGSAFITCRPDGNMPSMRFEGPNGVRGTVSPDSTIFIHFPRV